MNILGATYIADKLAAYWVKVRAGWRLACIERADADAHPSFSPRPAPAGYAEQWAADLAERFAMDRASEVLARTSTTS